VGAKLIPFTVVLAVKLNQVLSWLSISLWLG